MSLKERVQKAMQHKAAMEHDAQETAKLMANADPTQEMSGLERGVAGVGRGMTNVARQVGNMVGLIDDEKLENAERTDAYLMDTPEGQVGSFAGEMAALAPLGVAGSAAKGAVALPKALKAGAMVLPKAGGAGLPGAAAAVTEGALAGGILAGPGERMSGALEGGTTGLLLNKTLGAAGRKFAKGLDESAAAKQFSGLVEEATGVRPKLPVAQSAASPAAKYPHRSVLSMFPLARGGSKKMEAQTLHDWTEAVLMRGFGKRAGKEAVDAFKESGDFVSAVNKGIATSKPGALRQNKQALATVASKMKAGEQLTPNKLDAAAQTVSKGDKRPFYDLVSSFSKVMEEPLEESTVSGRRLYNKMMNKAVPATLGAAVSGGALPYLALTGATRGLTSGPAQNFLMGRTAVNKGADAVGKLASPYAAALRNRLAAGEY